LLSTVDWAGPNAAWERESWSRLAEEVMPALRHYLGSDQRSWVWPTG
jgi:hypothetical protein